jgi:hypothetical protein
MKRFTMLWGVWSLLSLVACQGDSTLLKAYRATSVDQLIGGPTAMADAGDFILENDKIRLAILDVEASPGPGVYGGTLVDADLQRSEGEFRNSAGNDQLAEMFPFVNLLSPRPDDTDVEIIQDGSDGQAAIIRVSGDGAFFMDALNVFHAPEIRTLFGDVKIYLHIETDYILEPGKSYVRMVSRATRMDPLDICSEDFSCELQCEAGYLFDEDGCPECLCAPETPYALNNAVVSEAIFTGLLGNIDTGLLPGLFAGDFVFFGGANDIFAPGIGFDEESPIFDGLFEGRDTFTHPLGFDYMAASGGNVSYGYFTVNPPGEPDPMVLVPIITSSATAFSTAVTNCSVFEEPAAVGEGEEQPPGCSDYSQWSWERYFAVGAGDIASIVDIIHEARGTPVGTLRGTVLKDNIEPEKNARVFVLHDPDSTVQWENVHDVVEANRRAIGSPGVLNAIEADVGLDPVEDGGFQATLPVGTYLLLATNEAMTTTSAIERANISEGEVIIYQPMLPPPAKIRYRVTDGQGHRIEAKFSFVSMDDNGVLAELDGLRRPYLGESRLGNGIQHIHLAADSVGVLELEPGSYRLFVSHGPAYAVAEMDIVAESGRELVINVILPEEIDTTGWIAFDSHLHAEPSFDSGMPMERRVKSIVVEGLDLAISSDHDVVTDYQPTVNKLGLQDRLATGIGVELSTLEIGHFIAFPLDYDRLQVPDHNAPDWACMDGKEILEELDTKIVPGAKGVRIVAHPRDGFIGYISQLGVNPFNMTRADLNRPKLDFFGNPAVPLALEGGNVLFRRATCDFDAIEVFNSKRFDLLRTPTVEEAVNYNLCMARIEVMEEDDFEGIATICPEVTYALPTPCDLDGRFFDCKMKHRRALAFESARRILIRTPEEQDILWDHVYEAGVDEDRCEADGYPDGIPSEERQLPCMAFPGTIDDWMQWLDRGLAITVIAASDSHGWHREPGTPRSWVPSSADSHADIKAVDVAKEIVAGRVMPSYGPFINVKVAGMGMGDTVSIAPGGPFTMNLRVQTASWFGVDRIEIYVSGRLQKALNLGHSPEVIIDYDGDVELIAPDTDGFVTVIAMGTEERNLLRPIYLDLPYGELQLPRIAALAFSALPGFSAIFPKPMLVPDFYPVFPISMTNPIFLDVDADGVWTPDKEQPAFCPRVCETTDDCPGTQVCLEVEGVCGYDIPGECTTSPPGLGALVQTLVE